MTGFDVCTAVVDLIKFEIKLGNVTVQLVVKAVEVMCALIGDVPVYQEVSLSHSSGYYNNCNLLKPSNKYKRAGLPSLQ